MPGVKWVIRCLVAAALFAVAAPAHAAEGQVEIEVLSNRADLVSGGDALVQVTLPPNASELKVDVDGRDVTKAFNPKGDGRRVGLVTNLDVGANRLTAELPDGRGARLTITNHPIGGPIFAGPQVQPWICNTQNPPANSGGAPTVVPVGLGPPRDAQCNTPPAISYVYKSARTGRFEPYDRDNPPADVATTTTDQGKTVPYVVRQEFGVQDRGLYAIGMLAEPGAWNGKVLTYFGASTAPMHRQAQPSAVLDDKALSRGWMTANSSMNVNGQNTNQVVSAEALLMLKEHVVERYGPIRYTIGEGCSGGSYQQMVAAMYPGLLDGLQPNCSFSDIWTTAPDVFDCGLLLAYFQENPHQPWVPSIDGHRDPSNCAAWYGFFFSAADPTNEGGCKLPVEDVYDPELRPGHVRCTVHDYQKAIWGPRPRSRWTDQEKKIGRGFANRPYGNAGIQYGLKALEQGEITPAQFVDLNAKIGGLTIDHKREPARSVVDEKTAEIAYRTGQILDAKQLATVPIIDLRAWSESAELHHAFHSYKTRARLDKANGTHANQIIWTFPAAEPVLGVTPPADIALKSFLLLDQWLSRIEADKSSAPLAQKVLRNRPAEAVDTCYTSPAAPAPGAPAVAPSQAITDPAQCALLYPTYGVTRTAAGGPMTDHIVQCRRKPLDPKDYDVTFTDAQLEQLRKTFDGGVCDYTRPSVGERRSEPWTTFADGPGGRPLGPAPRSVPFGPGAATGRRACVSRRAFRIRFRRPRGWRVTRAVVRVNGRVARAARARGRRGLRGMTIDLRGVRAGSVRVSSRLTIRRGSRTRTITDARRYRTCRRR